jgi:hypothetical protein
MTSIDKELEAAKAARAALNALLKTTPKSTIAATLRQANTVAVLNLSGQRGAADALNEARKDVGVVLSGIFDGPLKQEKIDKAKSAVEEWIKQLGCVCL